MLQGAKNKPLHTVGRDEQDDRDNTVKIRSLKPCSATLEVHINGKVVIMQYDPGAAKSVINKYGQGCEHQA